MEKRSALALKCKAVVAKKPIKDDSDDSYDDEVVPALKEKLQAALVVTKDTGRIP